LRYPLGAPEPKTIKNRLHLDLVPDDAEDKQAAIERLIPFGATRVDSGQAPGSSWVVLADPEGNEFCVLRPTGPWSISDERTRADLRLARGIRRALR
jgi:hypothetical protein